MQVPTRGPAQLLAALDRMAEEGMLDHYAHTVLDRAEAYYDLRHWSVPTVAAGTLTASVQGSFRYVVTASYDGRTFTLDCTCPYGRDYGNCKHEAAFLWLITDEWRGELEQALRMVRSEGPTDFDDYLAGLSADELRALLRQYAPAEFRREVTLRRAPRSVTEAALAAGVRQLDTLINGREHYGSPQDYEEDLARILQQLRPLLPDYAPRLLPQLRRIWTDVNERTDRGELYDDYSDGPFDNDDLVAFAAELVHAHPDPEAALRELYAIYEEEDEFGTFTGIVPALLETAPDPAALLPVLVRTRMFSLLGPNEHGPVYATASPHLDAAGRRTLLESLSREQSAALEAAYLPLLEAADGPAAALREITYYLREYPYVRDRGELLPLHLDLLERVRGRAAATAQLITYLKRRDTASEALYAYALTHYPEEQHGAFTAVLAEHVPAVLFRHYYGAEQPEAALDILLAHPGVVAEEETRVYEFYRDYGRRFPVAAAAFGRERLAVHLEAAHEREYAWVVRLLQLLREVLPPVELAGLVRSVQGKYYRRRKLLELMRGAGLG